MANSTDPQPSWIRPTMWASAVMIVLGLVAFFALAAIHSPLWLELVPLAVLAVGFILLGVSGRANVRSGGRRAGAGPDGRPTAINRWIVYVVPAGFVLAGATFVVVGIAGASVTGVVTGLFAVALGVAGYFILRKVSDDGNP